MDDRAFSADGRTVNRLARRSVLALGAAALAAGCAREPGGDRLSFWAMSYEGENAPVFLRHFERETGVGVDVQALPWTAAHQKVLTAFAGGSLPDVLMIDNDWLPELVMLDALRPLDDRSLLRGHFPAMTRAATLAGVPYAVPWTVGTQAQFYRRDLVERAGFAHPPPRRDEWTAMLRALKRRNPRGFPLLMLLDWPEHLMTFAAQEGAMPLRDRGRHGNFSSAPFRAALTYYKSLFDEALAPRVTIGDIGDPITAFASGWLAVLPSGAFTIGDLGKRAAQVPGALWQVARMPGPRGDAPAPVVGYSLVVTRAARDPVRAWALVRYLTGLPVQLRLYALTGELPSRPAAWAHPPLAGEAATRVFADQLADTAPTEPVIEWPRIQTEIQLVAERVARGALGIDDAVAEMDARADQLLAKRRWLLDRGLIA